MVEAVELTAEDAPAVLALYQQYGWWDDRSLAEVEHALAHTPLAVGVRESDEMVASARVLTDFTFYANVFDVIVASDRRGEGVGQHLLAAVVDHPDLADVDPTLMCREGLVGFYAQCGFDPYPESVAVPEGGTRNCGNSSTDADPR